MVVISHALALLIHLYSWPWTLKQSLAVYGAYIEPNTPFAPDTIQSFVMWAVCGLCFVIAYFGTVLAIAASPRILAILIILLEPVGRFITKGIKWSAKAAWERRPF